MSVRRRFRVRLALLTGALIATVSLFAGANLATAQGDAVSVAETQAKAGTVKAITSGLHANTLIRFVDGGDDLPCVDDVSCEWIEGCYLDDLGNPVYPGQEPPAPSTDPGTGGGTTNPGTGGTPTNGGGSGGGSNSGGTDNSGSSGGSGGKSNGSGESGGGSDNGNTTDQGAQPAVVDPATVTTTTDTTVDTTAEDTEDSDNKSGSVLPKAPAAPTVTVDGDSVTVTWKAPKSGSTPITKYRVKLSGQDLATAKAKDRSYTFTDLKPGRYRASVIAVSEIGQSEASVASKKVAVGDAATVSTSAPSPYPGVVAVSDSIPVAGLLTSAPAALDSETVGAWILLLVLALAAGASLLVHSVSRRRKEA